MVDSGTLSIPQRNEQKYSGSSVCDIISYTNDALVAQQPKNYFLLFKHESKDFYYQRLLLLKSEIVYFKDMRLEFLRFITESLSPASTVDPAFSM